MRLKDLVAELQAICEKSPDAYVMCDGMPLEYQVLPAYYDGCAKEYDPKAGTMTFARRGDKVMFNSIDLEAFFWRHPEGVLDLSALPNDSLRQFWREKEAQAKSAARVDATPACTSEQTPGTPPPPGPATAP